NRLKQKLTVVEEKIIVEYTLTSANWGFPPTHLDIRTQANTILESRQGPEYKPVSEKW
ncbi:hypothetical protein BOTBODRAFT_72631, partial [Botryobasidium botryosum FD-172 SS1]